MDSYECPWCKKLVPVSDPHSCKEYRRINGELTTLEILPAKGEAMPQTIEAWQRLYGLAEDAMKRQDDRIAELESQIAAKGKQEWISVKDACNDYMQFIRSDEFHEDKIGDYENTIFEVALTQVYGLDVFDEINSRLV